MSHITDYESKYADHYKSKFAFERILIEIRRNKILESFKKHHPDNILEVGCGLEPLFLFYKDFKSFCIVEPALKFTRHAQKLSRGMANVSIVKGCFEDVYQSLTAGCRFDFIVLSSLLHEVADPDRLLRSLKYICNRDTVVHINVPNVRSFHRLLAYEMGLIDDIFEKSMMEKKFHRHTRFDKALLFKMVKRNGFRILSYGTYFIKPFTHRQMEKIIMQKIMNRKVLKGLEKMSKYMPELGCELFVEAQSDSSRIR